jgi:hypothetical protein
MAFPMPLPPPVTTAVLLERLNIIKEIFAPNFARKQTKSNVFVPNKIQETLHSLVVVLQKLMYLN